MTASAFNTLGIVLAGGASVRMGRDKAELPWRGGVSLLEHMQTLMRTVCDEVLVSGKADGIHDAQTHGGPVLALQSIVRDPRSQAFDGVLLCAVDTPLLQADDLRLLLASLTSSRAAFFAEHFLPVALRRDGVLQNAVDAIANDEQPSQRSLKRLVFVLQAQELPLAEPQRERFTNLNTPELYQRYLMP